MSGEADYNEQDLYAVFDRTKQRAGEFERVFNGRYEEMRQTRTADGIVCHRLVTEVFSGCPFIDGWQAAPNQCGDGI